MKRIPAIAITIASVLMLAASVWEGTAVVAVAGELPEAGYYISTNSFPRNTVVDIKNLETNKTVRAIVAGGLDSPGLLAALSREAASAIGLDPKNVGRVRITMPADPIAFSRFTEGMGSSGDPDYDPKAAIENVLPSLKDQIDEVQEASKLSETPPEAELAKAETVEPISEEPVEEVIEKTIIEETAAIETIEEEKPEPKEEIPEEKLVEEADHLPETQELAQPLPAEAVKEQPVDLPEASEEIIVDLVAEEKEALAIEAPEADSGPLLLSNAEDEAIGAEPAPEPLVTKLPVFDASALASSPEPKEVAIDLPPPEELAAVDLSIEKENQVQENDKETLDSESLGNDVAPNEEIDDSVIAANAANSEAVDEIPQAIPSAEVYDETIQAEAIDLADIPEAPVLAEEIRPEQLAETSENIERPYETESTEELDLSVFEPLVMEEFELEKETKPIIYSPPLIQELVEQPIAESTEDLALIPEDSAREKIEKDADSGLTIINEEADTLYTSPIARIELADETTKLHSDIEPLFAEAMRISKAPKQSDDFIIDDLPPIGELTKPAEEHPAQLVEEDSPSQIVTLPEVLDGGNFPVSPDASIASDSLDLPSDNEVVDVVEAPRPLISRDETTFEAVKPEEEPLVVVAAVASGAPKEEPSSAFELNMEPKAPESAKADELPPFQKNEDVVVNKDSDEPIVALASTAPTSPQPEAAAEIPDPNFNVISLLPAEERPPIAPQDELPPEASVLPPPDTGPEPASFTMAEDAFITSPLEAPALVKGVEADVLELPPQAEIAAIVEAPIIQEELSSKKTESVTVESIPIMPQAESTKKEFSLPADAEIKAIEATDDEKLALEEEKEITQKPETKKTPSIVAPLEKDLKATELFGAPFINNLELGKYYLQLGAYSKSETVEAVLSKLLSYPTAVQTSGTNDKPIYRVFVGPVNRGESGALLVRLRQEGYYDVFVKQGS